MFGLPKLSGHTYFAAEQFWHLVFLRRHMITGEQQTHTGAACSATATIKKLRRQQLDLKLLSSGAFRLRLCTTVHFMTQINTHVRTHAFVGLNKLSLGMTSNKRLVALTTGEPPNTPTDALNTDTLRVNMVRRRQRAAAVGPSVTRLVSPRAWMSR